MNYKAKRSFAIMQWVPKCNLGTRIRSFPHRRLSAVAKKINPNFFRLTRPARRRPGLWGRDADRPGADPAGAAGPGPGAGAEAGPGAVGLAAVDRRGRLTGGGGAPGAERNGFSPPPQPSPLKGEGEKTTDGDEIPPKSPPFAHEFVEEGWGQAEEVSPVLAVKN